MAVRITDEIIILLSTHVIAILDETKTQDERNHIACSWDQHMKELTNRASNGDQRAAEYLRDPIADWRRERERINESCISVG